MTWMDNSEIVTGLALTRRISPTIINPRMFEFPYDKIIEDIVNGVSFEDIYLKNGNAVDAALMAVEHINGHHDLDFVAVLEKSKLLYDAGQKMSKISHQMLNGDIVDLSTIRKVINDLDQEKTGRRALSEIEPSQVPFVETGWEALDEHTGGLPEVGLVIVAGNPSVGKTSWAVKLASCFAKRYKDKKVAFYSLEMIDPEISLRFDTVDSSKGYKKRIEINCDTLSADELVNDAAKIENLGLVIVDFMDYLIRGEISDRTASQAYMTLAKATKNLGVPIVALSQFSYSYQGGIPRPYHIRYTSVAQIVGWMIICLWNPNIDFYAEDKNASDDLVTRPGYAYSIVWKSRGGFQKHLNDYPGAIMMQFDGKSGWSDKGRWRHITKS
jgi:hypothetical protein